MNVVVRELPMRRSHEASYIAIPDATMKMGSNSPIAKAMITPRQSRRRTLTMTFTLIVWIIPDVSNETLAK